MGCPSSCVLGDNLVFSICTHDATTGVLTDTDSAPTYRVYEDETGTAILNGTMAKLDDANTTGFYTELIEVTTANGFEDGKSYTIYVSATVDGDTGGIAFTFKAENPRVRAGWTTQLTESYAADGTAPTPEQSLFLIQQALTEFAISGTTITVKKLDGSTTAATYSLDDNTTPTSRTRAS